MAAMCTILFFSVANKLTFGIPIITFGKFLCTSYNIVVNIYLHRPDYCYIVFGAKNLESKTSAIVCILLNAPHKYV
jgi:hypothetical protein